MIDNVSNFERWIRLWYRYNVNEIKDVTLKALFQSVLIIRDNGSVNFMSAMLPHVFLQALVENNLKLPREFRREVVSVFRAIVTNKTECLVSIAQTIFSIIDYLHNYLIARRKLAQKVPL